MKIYISDCKEVWRGKSKFDPKKDSVLLSLTDKDGEKYTTDNPMYAAMVGQEVEIETELKPSKKLNKEGKPYMNLWIIEKKRQTSQPQYNFARLEGKIDEILSLLQDMNMPSHEVKDINDEQLPF